MFEFVLIVFRYIRFVIITTDLRWASNAVYDGDVDIDDGAMRCVPKCPVALGGEGGAAFRHVGYTEPAA